MSVVVITPPEVLPVDMGAARRHLHIVGDTDTDATDDDISRVIEAATGVLDGPSGWLGRCLITQTLEVRSDQFCDGLPLPFPPIGSVTSIKYDDTNNVEQTIGAGVYRIVGGSNSTLILGANQVWPNTNGQAECVRIRYTAGYGAAPKNVPAPIRQAILIMAQSIYGMSERNLFVSSETVDGVAATQYIVSDNAASVMKAAAQNLLATYRVFQASEYALQGPSYMALYHSLRSAYP
jgi:uncharacterized phiE125 gp8 family phage protein